MNKFHRKVHKHAVINKEGDNARQEIIKLAASSSVKDSPVPVDLFLPPQKQASRRQQQQRAARLLQQNVERESLGQNTQGKKSSSIIYCICKKYIPVWCL
jgi:hypothetical protein